MTTKEPDQHRIRRLRLSGLLLGQTARHPSPRNMAEALRMCAVHPTPRLAAGERLGFRIGINPVHYFESRKATA